MNRDGPVQQGLFAYDQKAQGAQPPVQGPNQGAPKPMTVSEATRLIKDKLVRETAFQKMLIVGEVYDVSFPGSGHIYFGIKDNDAVLRCVMWRSKAIGLNFKLEPGIKVLAYGNIGLYEKQGQYQLVVERLQPEGVGALHQAFEQLRKKLEAEGLFAPERKRKIKPFPRVVGLITSPSGAAIQDIIRVSTSRWPLTRILLAPVTVQGDTAAREIISAIGLLNDLAVQENIDVIMISRGGGSPEDLAAFNEEPLARAIVASRIPIVTGIGHEVDRTIADYVSDRSAATPSQAAEIVFPEVREQQARIASLYSAIATRTKSILVRRRERLGLLQASRAMARPMDLTEGRRQDLDDRLLAMRAAVKHIFENRRHSVALATRALSSLDPTAILGRGYSITLDSKGQVVKAPEQVAIGDNIKVIVQKGEVDAKVENKRAKRSLS